MANHAPGWIKRPEYRVDLFPDNRRVRVVFGDTVVADTTEAVRMEETNHAPVMYIPAKDVRVDLMQKTEHRTYCPFKGDCSYFTLNAGGKSSENAIWAYQTPYDEMAVIADRFAFYDTRVDKIEIG